MKKNLQTDKDTLLFLASLAVILLGLISYYFSITNPQRPANIERQLDLLEYQVKPLAK